jgi:hypothetical protein
VGQPAVTEEVLAAPNRPAGAHGARRRPLSRPFPDRGGSIGASLKRQIGPQLQQSVMRQAPAALIFLKICASLRRYA